MTQKIWFTSDNHYGHKNILKFSRDTRIGETVDEMNEKMIEIWNSQVALTDTVYCLGDFSFMDPVRTEKVLKRLNGRLHLIRGNHEHWINATTAQYFEWIKDYYELKMGDKKVVMFHFPIAEFNKMHWGAYHLHGHTHGSYTHPGRGFDVGIDNRPNGDMMLWEWPELVQILENKPILTHHGKVDS